MRSSDASGAGALGFRAGTRNDRKRRGTRSPSALALSFSRTTAAVAATAFLAASLFVAYDIAHTFANLRQDLAIIGEYLATELAGR